MNTLAPEIVSRLEWLLHTSDIEIIMESSLDYGVLSWHVTVQSCLDDPAEYVIDAASESFSAGLNNALTKAMALRNMTLEQAEPTLETAFQTVLDALQWWVAEGRFLVANCKEERDGIEYTNKLLTEAASNGYPADWDRTVKAMELSE